MSKSRHSATPYYAFIQALYWAVYCLMVGFASAFLQDKGFTNGQIGLTLGLSYLFSAVMQPVVGSLFSRGKLKLNYAIAFTYFPVVLISLCALLLPLGRIELMALMAIIFTIQSMMQPSVNTLYRNFETDDKKVNFSLARGVGSAAYALSSFVMGRLLAWFSPGFIPAVYCTLSIILIAALFFAPTTEDVNEAGTIKQSGSYAEIVKRYPMILLFLLGTGCMYLTYSFIDNFMLQILQTIGGTRSDLGMAITISAMMELPAMVLYSRFSEEKGIKIFILSIWIWLAKDILTLLAPTPHVLFAVQLLNFASGALYTPGMMQYMRRILPADELLRGVTMACTSITLGGLIATILGGQMMDLIGVRRSLMVAELFAVCGTVLLTISLSHALKHTTA